MHRDSVTRPQLVWFEWERDLAGYEIEEMPGGSGGTVLTEYGPSKWGRPRGGQRVKYQPLKTPGLYRRLAQVRKTEAGVLAFAAKYGLLGTLTQDIHSPETLSAWFDTIDVMRRLIRLAEQRLWPLLSRSLEKAELAQMSVKMPEWDETGPKLAIVPRTLRSALYLQFAQSVTSAEKLRQCEQCGTWFTYGPGTRRRTTAKYCRGSSCRHAAYLARQR